MQDNPQKKQKRVGDDIRSTYGFLIAADAQAKAARTAKDSSPAAADTQSRSACTAKDSSPAAADTQSRSACPAKDSSPAAVSHPVERDAGAEEKQAGKSDPSGSGALLPPDISIAIVSVSPHIIRLQAGIERMCGASCETHVFPGASFFLKEYSPGKYTFMFIDCGLPDDAAGNLLRYIRECGDFCPVICIAGFLAELPPLNKYHYFGVLPRPFRKSELDTLVQDAVRFTGHMPRALQFGPSSSPIRIAFSDIEYVMSDRHNVQVRTTLRLETFRRSFKSVAEELDDARFLPCNRGVIINMDYVDSCDDEAFHMRDGATFLIKRNGLRQVRNTYLEYAQERRTITGLHEK